MKMNSDPEWLKRMTDLEDGCDVSVGGMDYAERLARTLDPLCPDSLDGNHHSAPIGTDEEYASSEAPCYYCGEKPTRLA